MVKAVDAKGKWASWLIAPIIVAGLLALMWPSAQAADGSTGVSPTAEPIRVYIPLALYNAPAPPSVFAVEMQEVSIAGGQAQAIQSGARWIRFGAFNWDEIEPLETNPPQYQWSAVDEQSLKNIAAMGKQAIAIVRFAPSWAQKVPGSACGPIKEAALDDFAAFLGAAVEEYSKPPYNVLHWELGNEPDVRPSVIPPDAGWGCWGDENDDFYGGGYYAEMLKVAYPAIKAADPDAQVIVGGLLLDCDPDNPPPGRDCTPYKFLEGILLNGGGPYFDILAYHVYTYYGGALGKMGNEGWPGSVTALPEKTAFVRRVLTQYGQGDKPLMNTESAMLCPDATSDCLETQAIYVPRAYAEAMALGLQAQSFYALNATGWWNSGLLNPNLTPKPAYLAFRAASSFLSTSQYLGEATGYPRGVEGYSFRRSRPPGQIDVLWSADGSLRKVTRPPGSSAYDHYGQLIASPGKIQVERKPIYIARP